MDRREFYLAIIAIQDFRSVYTIGTVVNEYMFCAGQPNSGRGSCSGDHGGPFVIDGQLLGRNTLHTDCVDPKGPGLIQRVSFFTDWIEEVISSN